MSNNIAFSRSRGEAFVKSLCQARNFGGYPSQFSIVQVVIPVFGFGSFASASFATGAVVISYNDDWPDVYSTLTETWIDSAGYNGTVTTNYTQYMDAGGPGPFVTSSGTFNPNFSLSTMSFVVSPPSGIVGTYTNTGAGFTGTYTATLTNKWFGSASLSAFWAAMDFQALTLLSDFGTIPTSIGNIVIANPGSGYQISPIRDDLNVQGGTTTFPTYQAIQVSGVDGSGRLTALINQYQSFQVPPSPLFGNVPTGGHGTGAVLNLTMVPGNLEITVYPISVSPFWQAQDGFPFGNFILASARGFPCRSDVHGAMYPFAPSIVDNTHYNSSPAPNLGYFLTSQSLWQLSGLGFSFATNPVTPLYGKHTIIYGQTITIIAGAFSISGVTQPGSLNLTSGGALPNPIPIAQLSTFVPSDVVGNIGTTYGILGFQPTAA